MRHAVIGGLAGSAALGLAGCGSGATPPRDPAGGTTTTPATSSATGRRVAGDVIHNRWGDNQVTLTVQGDRIVDVALALPTDRPRSAAINAQAGPLLRQEILKRQRAAVDVISGATFTSDAANASLATAVKRLGG